MTTPLVREGGRLVEADWETAMTRVVERSCALLATKGPLSRAGFRSAMCRWLVGLVDRCGPQAGVQLAWLCV